MGRQTLIVLQRISCSIQKCQHPLPRWQFTSMARCGTCNALIPDQLLNIQEPNTKWTDHLHHHIQRIFQQMFHHTALSTSNSTKPSNTYQPGGTALTIVGPHATWLISSGQDTRSMGCWSYIELHSKHNKCLVIASAYCVRSQKAKIGSTPLVPSKHRSFYALDSNNHNHATN